MGEHCALCLSSVFSYSSSEYGPSEQARYDLFHQPCSACSVVDSQAGSLCGFCQHLRLRHLVRCVEPKTRMKLLFSLHKGLVEDHFVTECQFCRLVNHMIVVGLSAAQLSEVRKANCDIVLYPGLPQDSQPEGSSVFSAEIWAHYSEGDGLASIWVGDLHIDDIKKGEAFHTSSYASDPYKKIEVATASPVGEMVSWVSLMGRINECYRTHSECQWKAQCSLPPGFRVIDVNRRCLVEKSSCRFVALSYVWGFNPQSSLLAASRATVGGMKKEGGLPALKMPRTIEDAIEICVRMGERYLWADRLCIIQDDADDKKSQIEAMGDIYSSAQLVLVAAYGDSMEFGIPGISAPRKAVQHSEDVLDLQITNVIRDAEDDPLHMWDTRAWTYQEAVLSNRRLSFTDTRAFFECERSICHEDQFNLEEIRNELFSTRLTIPEDGSRFQSFTRHLKHYTSRNITYRSDAHKALYGICMSLYIETGAFINGLPVVDFDRALLWYPDIGENAIERQETQGEILPTWSWSSVMGLSDPVHYRAAEFYGTLAPWYHINDHVTSSGSIAALNGDPDSELDDDWQVVMAIAIKEGCVRNMSLAFSLETDSFPTVREIFKTRWKDYHSFRRETIPLAIKTSGLPHGISTDAAKKGVIATESHTALLRVTPRPSYSLDIINSKGEIIGGFCGDAAKLREQAISPGYDSHAEFEFISLSLSGAKSYSEDSSLKNYFDVDGNSLNKVPIVNVLMIANSGGCSHRRELGWIYLIDWAKLRREWRTIVLE